MKLLVVIGLVLVVLGLVGLIFGGITYTSDKEEVDLGPIDITVEEKEQFSLHPVFGAAMLVVGIVVIALGVKRGPKRVG